MATHRTHIRNFAQSQLKLPLSYIFNRRVGECYILDKCGAFTFK